MKRSILIISIICINICVGISQNERYQLTTDDAIRIEKAKAYLIRNSNKSFVNDSIELSDLYKSGLYMVTFEIKNQYKNDNRNMLIIFIGDTLIDTVYNTKITKKDIERYYKGKTSKNIYYNKNYALNLAKKLNFEKGNKDWICELDGVKNDVSWNIYATTFEQEEHPHQKGGKLLKINAISGKYEILDWDSIE